MAEKIQGSIELKESLPYGVLRKISDVFDIKGQNYVSDVISGKRTGNPLFIECAERISDAYLDCGFEEKLKEILKDYDTRINKTRE